MADKEPEWMDCTVAQWEKKSELSMMNGDIAKALLFADYANCKEMHNNGKDIETIQERFGL